ncbi:MAG: cysteine synthase family protein [Alphaproteobacteria bacterium]
MIYESITEMVGNTPMLRLKKIEELYNTNAKIYAKLEFYNPLFSVKDRAALFMIENANPTADTVFVEATSGNTGVSLSSFCAAKGYKLIITMPESMSAERIKLMRHFGTEVILTPASEGMQGSVDKALEIVESNPNAVYINQFNNEENPKAHIFTTAVEILDDMDGNIDALVLGVGTAGTLSGISQTLKSVNKNLKVVGVLPESQPHKIMGIGANFKPPFFEEDLIDEQFLCSDEKAIEMAKVAAKLEGLPIGISSGAALAGVVEQAQREDMKDKNIVTLFASSAERYLSTGVFD